jgi:hypothetical protein
MIALKNEKKGRIRAVFLSVACVAVAVALLVLIGGNLFSPNATAAQVDSNLNQISQSIQDELEKKSLLGYSSNPYDYIANNAAYDRLVSLGAQALPWLEKALESSKSNGLIEYIIAIAIEDVAKTNIREQSEAQWATPKEFLDQWRPFVESACAKTESILQSAISDEQKIAQLKSLGILALPTLCETPETSKVSSLLRDYVNQLLKSADPALQFNGDWSFEDIASRVEKDLQEFKQYVIAP